jgi:hypothetical protein
MISNYKTGMIVKARSKLPLYYYGNGVIPTHRTYHMNKDEIGLVLSNHDNLFIEIMFDNRKFIYADYYGSWTFPFQIIE